MSDAKQYVTPEGHKRLAAELARLGEERQRVVHAVADAAAEGDRSENAEYIYGKKRLREIDKRMRFLSKVIEASVVVDPSQDRGDKVYFGATVVLEDDDGRELVYQLVGEHETDTGSGRISYQSPVGAALLRKEVDDVVSVKTPSGTKRFTIVEVRYR